MKQYFSKQKWSYLFYTISHPMDGYYWIRHKEYGSVPIALLLVVFLAACFTGNRLLSSFVVNDIDPRAVDGIYELAGVLLFFLLICVANWSVTCLMNGEGRFKDIVIAVGYATFPISVGLLAATVLSRAVADTEEAFYYIVLGIGIAYGVILALTGIMQIHNYTLGKTLITLFLTFLVVLVIVFLILLVGNLMSLVYVFFKSIYTELIFRT